MSLGVGGQNHHWLRILLIRCWPGTLGKEGGQTLVTNVHRLESCSLGWTCEFYSYSVPISPNRIPWPFFIVCRHDETSSFGGSVSLTPHRAKRSLANPILSPRALAILSRVTARMAECWRGLTPKWDGGVIPAVFVSVLIPVLVLIRVSRFLSFLHPNTLPINDTFG